MKGQRHMPHPSIRRSPCDSTSKEESQLAKYRAKSAAMVHKDCGDAEEIGKQGLATFQALSRVRERANATALKKDE
ncbi:MAG: hypothetical protein WAL71_12895 [Terriglobales bacterium]|jgi:hypothetical protein